MESPDLTPEEEALLEDLQFETYILLMRIEADISRADELIRRAERLKIEAAKEPEYE